MDYEDKTLPVYSPQVTGVGCATHSDPHCLCDVHIGTPAPIYRGSHMMHGLVLDYLDADTVSAQNLHQFLTTLIGCWETFRDGQPINLRVKKCEWCGIVMPPARTDRVTCSNACKLKKSRASRKAAANVG